MPQNKAESTPNLDHVSRQVQLAQQRSTTNDSSRKSLVLLVLGYGVCARDTFKALKKKTSHMYLTAQVAEMTKRYTPLPLLPFVSLSSPSPPLPSPWFHLPSLSFVHLPLSSPQFTLLPLPRSSIQPRLSSLPSSVHPSLPPPCDGLHLFVISATRSMCCDKHVRLSQSLRLAFHPFCELHDSKASNVFTTIDMTCQGV